MHTYIGSGPYCYANSLAMVLGSAAPSPSVIEVLTGSPFGISMVAGRLPFFDPYGFDPDMALDGALELLGWTCDRGGAANDEQALARLREAVEDGPVLVGPMEFGLLRHLPGMTGPIASDHFVTVLEADEQTIVFHDPSGCPYATLPTGDFVAAWRADTLVYETTPYTMRSGFRRVRDVTTRQALRASLPRAVAWLRGRDELPMPAGSLGGVDAALRLADMVAAGLDPQVDGHLTYFAIRVGVRRLADAATALGDIGHERGAAITTRQARLVGTLQYDIVAGRTASAVDTLHRLAPTYAELADVLA